VTEDYARMRSEEMHARYAVISAETDVRVLHTGVSFALDDGPVKTENEKFLIISHHLSAENEQRSSAGGSGGPVYECSFEAIDLKHPFRPARATPKPLIPGPQSATVVGPEGATDFHTDEWGRVFVKFHWARKVAADDKDVSCYVRVSQNSAGADWGSMFVPHIGQEVIVGFYEGDPDRPVIIGRVYNGANKPPLALPDQGYKSIVRDHYGNEIIFDGTPGDESMTLHSPSHSSVVVIGKSVDVFTESDTASLSFNSKSFSLGSTESYSFGNSFSVTRGTSRSFTLGLTFGVSIGASANLSASTALEFKAGASCAINFSTSAAFGFARDFKSTKGEYTRASADVIAMSSKTKVFIAGGEHDKSLFMASKDEISLSLDPSAAARDGEIASQDAKAKKVAAGLAGASAAMSALAAWAYNQEWTDVDTTDDKGKVTHTAEKSIKSIDGFVAGDAASVAGALAAAGAAAVLKGKDVPHPEHKAPTAKVVLKNDSVQLFAGEKKEVEFLMNKNSGAMLAAKKELSFASDEADINLTAKGKFNVKCEKMVVDAVIDAKNFKVMK
jgi:hypothetical protein